MINPNEIDSAATYSDEANFCLLMIVAITIVGINLHDRKTTLVGKLMKFNDKLERLEDANKQNAKAGYALIGATRPVSLAM
mmetsp:Transcript_30370/g.29268  ORF Transcript_30370/g.29268 Transcript_30370/m.29268 type:complete len:81 (-) Transcript_30370:1004-1246(-)